MLFLKKINVGIGRFVITKKLYLILCGNKMKERAQVLVPMKRNLKLTALKKVRAVKQLIMYCSSKRRNGSC
jgi:hypothetical protein